MNTHMNFTRILICAGEASGDMHAAALMRALRERIPGPVVFRGFGGDAMQAEGAEIFYHTDRTAMVGVTPILKNLPFLVGMMRRMKREIIRWKPDLVLTVDYPGMNLRLAKFAHDRGFKTVHYICPQVWAWHRNRIPKIARMLDLLLCILPFEPDLFKGTPLKAVFTGHPLVHRAAETRAEPPAALPWAGRYRIALLPGSRSGEITHILPRLLEAARKLESLLDGDCSFVIPAPSRAMRALGEAVLAAAPVRPQRLFFVDGQARQVMLQAQAAAVASGTATLEACLMRCPTVLVYVASPLTYRIAKFVIKGVRHLGLANIIAGRDVMPELLQDAFTPLRLADLLHRYLTDPETRKQAIADLDDTNAKLGSGDASARAADAITALIPACRTSIS
jgi:lipid-A-disaccharide synthase